MITGSAESIAASAMTGALTFAYKEWLCHDPIVQSTIIKNAVDMIYQAAEDPFWAKRKDKNALLSFWLAQIGVTV